MSNTDSLTCSGAAAPAASGGDSGAAGSMLDPSTMDATCRSCLLRNSAMRLFASIKRRLMALGNAWSIRLDAACATLASAVKRLRER